MNQKQKAWLKAIAGRIPLLFDAIEAGNVKFSFIIGERVIDGRTVKLSLVTEVVDPGRDPLVNHASAKYPKARAITVPDNMAKPPTRNRERSKRW